MLRGYSDRQPTQRVAGLLRRPAEHALRLGGLAERLERRHGGRRGHGLLNVLLRLLQGRVSGRRRGVLRLFSLWVGGAVLAALRIES